MSDLKAYIVTMENGQLYRFWAENEDHAKEQAKNADPDNEIEDIHLEFLDA